MTTDEVSNVLGWWRQLTIALSAFGIYFFDLRGLHELCAEEIYFWIFLNLILWMFCLVAFLSLIGRGSIRLRRQETK